MQRMLFRTVIVTTEPLALGDKYTGSKLGW
jgi:hypothetical protein